MNPNLLGEVVNRTNVRIHLESELIRATDGQVGPPTAQEERMKYTLEITIDAPRERVIELFDNPEYMPKWQPGLTSFEPLEGTRGQPGAKSRLTYETNGRSIQLVETVTRRELPDEFSGTYEAKGVWNGLTNRFYDEDGQTRWVIDSEFRFSGMMALVGLLMPSSFSNETRAMMARFKAFAESA